VKTNSKLAGRDSPFATCAQRLLQQQSQQRHQHQRRLRRRTSCVQIKGPAVGARGQTAAVVPASQPASQSAVSYLAAERSLLL